MWLIPSHRFLPLQFSLVISSLSLKIKAEENCLMVKQSMHIWLPLTIRGGRGEVSDARNLLCRGCVHVCVVCADLFLTQCKETVTSSLFFCKGKRIGEVCVCVAGEEEQLLTHLEGRGRMGQRKKSTITETWHQWGKKKFMSREGQKRKKRNCHEHDWPTGWNERRKRLPCPPRPTAASHTHTHEWKYSEPVGSKDSETSAPPHNSRQKPLEGFRTRRALWCCQRESLEEPQ